MIPHRTPFFLPLFFPSSLVWRMAAPEKKIYLTFDDGPVYGPTEFVLDTLRVHNVEGTFFCIGDNVRKHPELFKRILAGGHAVANHTYHHLNGWSADNNTYFQNIRLCDEVMGKSAEEKRVLFRPPYGRITRKQVRLLADYKIIMWDVLTMDYNRSLSPERCFANSVAATREGSIVVFHDSLKAEPNLRYVLPRYIEHFQKNGYTFEKLE